MCVRDPGGPTRWQYGSGFLWNGTSFMPSSQPPKRGYLLLKFFPACSCALRLCVRARAMQRCCTRCPVVGPRVPVKMPSVVTLVLVVPLWAFAFRGGGKIL